MDISVAGPRVRRLGSGVKKLAASVHAHGSWEEGAIFDFLARELHSFGPFHAALTGEHLGSAEEAAEVSLLKIAWDVDSVFPRAMPGYASFKFVTPLK